MKFAVVILLLGILVQTLAIVTTNPADAANKTFDYIVVGAGLTGITVASRLAEDPSIGFR
jgi:NADH dehydrogenase FAD-containing subunit